MPDAPMTAAPRPLVLASPPPIPLEVIILWLRDQARKCQVTGELVELSPLLARRIAAELEEKP